MVTMSVGSVHADMAEKDWDMLREHPGRLHLKGDTVATHAHRFPHITCLWGKCEVQQLEVVKWEGAPNASDPLEFRVVRVSRFLRGGRLRIDAGVWHAIIAHEDGVDYSCFFLNRDEDGNVVDFFTGWDPAWH